MSNHNPTNPGRFPHSLVHDPHMSEAVVHNMLLSRGYVQQGEDSNLFTKGSKKFRVFPPTSGNQGLVSMVACTTDVGTEQLLATFPIVDDQMQGFQDIL